MNPYARLLRPLLFRIPAEVAHDTALSLIASGLVRGLVVRDPRLRRVCFGAEFAHPLGLAAGFDKNAVASRAWHRLGFAFVEYGTITRWPQPGNPRPRLFRLPEHEALVNRLGFNNDGAAVVGARLRRAGSTLPFGLNLGLSRITPLERAPEDYAASFRLVHDLGRYFVINVSSPNTPGLRGLQDRGALREIIAALKEVDSTRPLLVKVSPDLDRQDLDEVLGLAVDEGLAGIVATNTTLQRPGGIVAPEGGLSGRPLKNLANRALSHFAENRPPGLVLIGVGGVFGPEDVLEKLQLGADLVQVYTGWVYGGPRMVGECVLELIRVLDERGAPSLDHLTRRAGA